MLSLPDEDGTRSFRHNAGVPLGVLRQNVAAWTWAARLLRSRQSQRALRVVQYGYRPTLVRQVLRVHKHNTNYVSESSPEGDWVTKQLCILLRNNSIYEVGTPACPLPRGWLQHPMFVVPKPGGGLRLIIDMRGLNAALDAPHFSLPSLHGDRSVFSSSTGIFTFDFTSGYQHIVIADDARHLFGLHWRGRSFVMCVLPYGVSTAPELFQSVASVPGSILAKLGIPPTLTTPDSWRDVFSGKHALPPPAERYSLTSRQYLDDFAFLVTPTLRSMAGTIVTGDAARALARKLALAIRALFQAFGWLISSKSQLDPFSGTNVWLGMGVAPDLARGTFFLPERKRTKLVAFCTDLYHRSSWTPRLASRFAGKILHLKLLWGRVSAHLIRPIYDRLSRLFRRPKVSWSTVYQPSSLERDMVHRALASLDPDSGSGSSLLRAPIFPRDLRLSTAWELDGTLPETLNLFTDASDFAVGAWLTTSPASVAWQATESIISHQREMIFWSLLPEEHFDESSTLRELQAVFRAYQEPRIFEKCMQGSTPLVHFLDSQAATQILRRGSSKSPACHAMAMDIWDLMAPIRAVRPVLFAWIPRECNRVADAASKALPDWCILPAVFHTIDSCLGFTLDAFAAPTERLFHIDGSPVPYHSRFGGEGSLGHAQVCGWGHHTVWAFPPAVSWIILLALQRCFQASSPTLLVLPYWPQAPWFTTVRASRYDIAFTLPPGAATRIRSGLDPATHSVRYERCRHPTWCLGFHMDERTVERLRQAIPHLRSVVSSS